MTATLKAALYYARRGWQVLPIHSVSDDSLCDCGNPNCVSPGKHPWLHDGLKGATTDPEKVRDWFTQKYPAANVAIVTGRDSGAVVLDVDTEHGGDESLAELIEQHDKLPNTIEAKTGGGGRHIFFAHPGFDIKNSAGKIAPGLDIRGDGGYVVGSPSKHVSGQRYMWEASSLPSQTPLAAMPPWLIDLVRDPAGHTNGKVVEGIDQGAAIEWGQRNERLFSEAGSMRRKGMTQEAIESALLIDNRERCVPPLPIEEVLEIARGITRYRPEIIIEETHPGTVDEPILRPEPDGVTWLWPSLSYSVGLDLLHETAFGLVGEIAINAIDRRNDGDTLRRLHTSRFNLTGMDDRTKLIRILKGRREGIDWEGMLEMVCYRTIEHWRKGEYPRDLSSVVQPLANTFAIDKLLPLEQTSLIFADGGVGKSWLALAIAVAFRTGIALPGGLRPRATGNVLYLDWETEFDDHNQRLAWLCRGMGISVPDQIHHRKMIRSLPDDAPQIRKFIKDLDARLVVIDSIAPACGGQPEEAATMTTMFNAMRSLSHTTRLVLSHVSYAGVNQNKGTAHPFGSVFTKNLSRSVWEARRDGDEIALFHRKANNGPLEQPIGLRFSVDPQTFTTTVTGTDIEDSPELVQHGPLRLRIRAALRNGPLNTSELAKVTESSDAAVRAMLSRMTNEIAKAPGNSKVSIWQLKPQVGFDDVT